MTAAGPEPSELQPDAKEAMSIITSTFSLPFSTTLPL